MTFERRLELKIVKESAIIAVIIFVFNLLMELLFDFNNFSEGFEKGFVQGIGHYLILLITAFLIVLMIMVISKLIFNLKNSNKNE